MSIVQKALVIILHITKIGKFRLNVPIDMQQATATLPKAQTNIYNLWFRVFQTAATSQIAGTKLVYTV